MSLVRFPVLAADCPWPLGDSLPGPKRGAASHYDLLTISQLEHFPLPPLRKDALLFLWVVESMQGEALRVCRAWGFTPKSSLIWIKTTKTGKRHFGMGRYVRAEHERCIIASRGKGRLLIKSNSVRSTFEAPVGPHSAKPEKFYEIVEELVDGPYAELFARRRRGGNWTHYGKELEAA